MNRSMEFELLFRAQTAAAKNATNDLRGDVAALGNEVSKTAAAFDREAAAINRDTEATRKNSAATSTLMEAERKAREDALRASGAIPAAPVRRFPQQPTPSPPSNPPPQNPPANDNERRDRNRRQVASYQYFDIGQGLMGGMPLPMIAAQQLPQLAQLYAGQGGMNEALKDFRVMAGGAARAITPLTVGIAGLTAVVATGALAYNGYLRSTKEVETAASGLGRAMAGSKAEMEASARAGAAAAGISVSSARSMEAQFLRTGRIGSENFEALIAISKDFGATMGIETEAAGAMLAEMFADPAKAADTLFQKYGLIDAATARHATNLSAQNRQSEAQAALLKALPDQLANASEATTVLGRAWDWAGRKASDAGNAIGGAIDGAMSGPSGDARIAQLQKLLELPRLRGREGFQAELNGLLEEQAKAADERQKAEERARSRTAVPIYEASPANARRLQEQRLRNDIATLRSVSGLEGVDNGQNNAAIEAKTRALDALVNRQQRSVELDRLDIQISNERNPLVRADLEARRTSIQLADQELSATTVANEAARARNRVMGETIAAASSQASEMRLEVETRARLNTLVATGAITSADANRMLQEEITLRPLIAAAMTTDIEKRQSLLTIIDDLKSGYASLAEQEKRASVMEYMRGQNEKLEQLRLEQALIGQNNTTRTSAIALLQAEQKIRGMGLSTTSAEAGKVRELALEQANLTREIDKQGEAWGRVQKAGQDAIGSVVDGVFDGDFKGALDGIKDAMTNFVKDDIKNTIANCLTEQSRDTLA